MKLYEVTDNYLQYCYIAAPNKKEVRAEFKRLYPNKRIVEIKDRGKATPEVIQQYAVNK